MVGKSLIYSEPVVHEPPTQVRDTCQNMSPERASDEYPYLTACREHGVIIIYRAVSSSRTSDTSANGCNGQDTPYSSREVDPSEIDT